jgi:hypothetical protein
MECAVVVADSQFVQLSIGRNRHIHGDDERLGEEELIGCAGKYDRRVERVEQDRLPVKLDHHGRDPGAAEPGFDLGSGQLWIAALIELVLEGAIRISPAEQADPDRDRRRLDLDAGSLENAVGWMGRCGRVGKDDRDGDRREQADQGLLLFLTWLDD